MSVGAPTPTLPLTGRQPTFECETVKGLPTPPSDGRRRIPRMRISLLAGGGRGDGAGGIARTGLESARNPLTPAARMRTERRSAASGLRSIHPPRSSRPRTPVMVAGWVRVRRAAEGRAGPRGRRP